MVEGADEEEHGESYHDGVDQGVEPTPFQQVDSGDWHFPRGGGVWVEEQKLRRFHP
jgi:hypothetical protein